MITFWSSSISRLRALVLAAGLIVSLPSIGAVHLVFERDIDIAGQTDLFLISYASQADFVSNTAPAQTALPQAIAGNFSLGGLTVDALGGWHLIFERDIDIVGQTDLFLISYASQADFVSNTAPAQTALPQAIAGNFSLGGLSVDALGGWHLIFERDIDIVGQTDLFLISYASQADFVSSTAPAQTALPQAIAGNFSLGGFHIDVVSAPPPNGVPAPGTAPLLVLGVVMLWLYGRPAREALPGRDCRT